MRLCTAWYERPRSDQGSDRDLDPILPQLVVRPLDFWFACQATAVQRSVPCGLADACGIGSRIGSLGGVKSAFDGLSSVGARLEASESLGCARQLLRRVAEHLVLEQMRTPNGGSTRQIVVRSNDGSLKVGEYYRDSDPDASGGDSHSSDAMDETLPSLSWLAPSVAWQYA